MVLARDVAIDLAHEVLALNQGPFLLGATSPDIRVITKQDRLSTHFFDLSGPDHQDSVGGFFSQHGRFLEPDQLNAETLAWVCGYISHLVMDEQYITGMYRKFFARHEELGGAIRANVMDRLLQFDLDRVYGNDPELKRHMCSALSCTVVKAVKVTCTPYWLVAMFCTRLPWFKPLRSTSALAWVVPSITRAVLADKVQAWSPSKGVGRPVSSKPDP